MFEVSTTPINWLDAQSSCAIWGGDLTSITTERENNYLNTIITSSVGNCWIGLNDRDVEGTYTWIDGTMVSYTDWTTQPTRNITGTDVTGYYTNSTTQPTSNIHGTNATSNYTNSTTQSTSNKTRTDAAGNYTNSTTQPTNNIHMTNATSNYTNNTTQTTNNTHWTTLPVNNSTSTTPLPNVDSGDCVQINNARNGMWESVSCDTTLDAFICKRDSSSTVTIGLLISKSVYEELILKFEYVIIHFPDGRFGMLTDGGLSYQELSPDRIFYESLTLVCGGDDILWAYVEYNPDFDGDIQPPTYMNTQLGLSWLAINVTKQGFYGCGVHALYFKEIGVFDSSVTTGEFLHLSHSNKT